MITNFKNIITVFLLLFVLLLQSCSTISHISIDVLKPAEIDYNYAIRKVAIVNSKFNNKYLKASEKGKRDVHRLIKERKTALCIDSLIVILNLSTRFDTIEFLDYDKEIKLSDAREIAKKLDVDGLIIFNSYYYYSSKTIQDHYPFESYFSCDLYLSSEFIWKLYDLNNHKFSEELTYIYNDSWSGHGDTKDEATKSIPGKDELAEEVFGDVGKYIGQKITPQWTPENRVYYNNGNSSMRKVSELVNENKWEEAAEIWNQNSNSDNKTIAKNAQFNLALYYEIQGDIEKAYKTSSNLFKLNNDQVSKNYSNLLHTRIIDQYTLYRELR